MIRSLFAGVAGMKNHQIRMDVIGNNISNVNTVGFKSGRANFQDVLYQTLKSAGTSTNPAQVGLGVSLAGISNNMSPGGLQSTGRTLDLAINGDGFFKVIDPGSGKEYYTRDGVFYIDQNGYVVNSSGYRLVGASWNKAKITGTEANPTISADGYLELKGTLADGSAGKATAIQLTNGMTLDQVIEKINEYSSTTGVTASKDQNNNLVLSTIYNDYTTSNTLFIDPNSNSTQSILTDLGLTSGDTAAPTNYTNNTEIFVDNVPVATINIQDNGIITATGTSGDQLTFSGGFDATRISLYIFNNQDGLQRVNKNLFAESVSSGTATPGKPGSAGYGTIESGYLEMSNVDLTDEFTNMITTQRGYQASARIITVSDTMLEELINLKR
ncbi:flagellar hook-basal body complex protein [Desulfofundulus sp. TPOSR]|uniref:flagellar hook protein FlgE n=1 Tax=Desulfofundulus sp. TPOSR TaxID=2714340 RepID=UPI00140ACE67|nr:flagellar hook-basal body complex protein [Desulfofundulus sp. TPOSR]NHM28214.1 flagellar hook-basal body complex protein [Desulfofundulus sp. TPOSR]